MHLPDSATAQRYAETLSIDATRSSGAEIEKLLESLLYDRAELIQITTLMGSETFRSPDELKRFWQGFKMGRQMQDSN